MDPQLGQVAYRLVNQAVPAHLAEAAELIAGNSNREMREALALGVPEVLVARVLDCYGGAGEAPRQEFRQESRAVRAAAQFSRILRWIMSICAMVNRMISAVTPKTL